MVQNLKHDVGVGNDDGSNSGNFIPPSKDVKILLHNQEQTNLDAIESGASLLNFNNALPIMPESLQEDRDNTVDMLKESVNTGGASKEGLLTDNTAMNSHLSNKQ